MKKFYFILFVLAGLSSFTSEAQTCTPDPQYTAPGVYPDSATNFASATVGVAYNQNITLVVPTTTVVGTPPFTFTVNIDSIHLVSITNLPPGLTYACSPSKCSWNGGTTGCAVIYGTPTVAGTYSLTVNVNGYAAGSTSPVAQTITYYKIVVNPNTTGLVENTVFNYEVKQNAPNPFSNKTTVKVTVPTDDKIKISVVNMLGKVVMEKRVDATKGENEIDLDGRNLAGGIYFYTVDYKGKTVTRRMMVTNY
jgi:hypothetical protein